MHLVIALLVIAWVWLSGVWRKWRQYQSTMLYMFAVAMTYEFLTKDYKMWHFHPDFLLNRVLAVMVYAVVSMPLSTLLFLAYFPETERWKQLRHYLVWVAIYGVIEVVLSVTGRIMYEHRWNFWWSLVFDVIMFPMLRLHSKNPLVAYILSIPIVVGYLLIFQVPVS